MWEACSGGLGSTFSPTILSQNTTWCHRSPQLSTRLANCWNLLREWELKSADHQMLALQQWKKCLGQRNDSLAWFWRMPGNNGDQYNSWMQECKYIGIVWWSPDKCYGSPVYQVNFLRAKARHDRWEEELKIVCHEMKWCVLYFQHQKRMWEGWAQECGMQAGHKAYAHKQIFLWQRFAEEGEHKFRGKMIP
jgi:hypothetical protein